MSFKKKIGFTLNELIMVVIIVGILAAIAIPSYYKTVQVARAKEAKSALRLIQAGQKIYRSKNPGYYDSDNITDINTNLGLDLEESYWDYRANSATPIGTAKYPLASPTVCYQIGVSGDAICCPTYTCPE